MTLQPLPPDPASLEQAEQPPLGPEPVPEAVNPPTFAEVAALLERHNLPALVSVEPIAEDDPSALILNGEMVLLTHHAEPATSTLIKQALIYRRLKRAQGVPCPEVLALDTTREVVHYDALLLSRMAGVNAATVWNSLGDETREALSEETGRIIASIHGLQWPLYGEFESDSGAFGHYARWTDNVLARIERIALEAAALKALPQRIIDSVVTEINDGDSVLETASAPVLVHGDLHTANLLVEQRDGQWHVAAVLDWESALTADAAWEFAGLWIRHAEREPFHDAFLYGYRERRPAQADLQSRIHLYRMMLHLEGAVISRRAETYNAQRHARHEAILRRMLRRLP